ncbi:hypothetical protein JTB14_001822 [Gonioctena quinquepunctata]|nr:hypothetical protein JTB14_001822 [Gonioctena quinquepunctata]
MDRYLKKFKDDSGRQGQEVKRFEYPDGTVQPSVSGQQTEFQSESFRAHILLPRIRSIYTTVLNNFMKASYVKNCNLDKVAFLPENYLELNNIYFGADCEVLILKKSVPEDDLKSFRVRCLSFYIELCKELKSRFKFNDPVLNFVQNLDPKIVTKSPKSIIPIYLKFRSLFSNNVNLEELSTEWRNIAHNQALSTHADKPIEEFWNIVFDTQNCSGDYMYPNLTEFVQGIFAFSTLICISRKDFSQINLIKTKTEIG